MGEWTSPASGPEEKPDLASGTRTAVQLKPQLTAVINYALQQNRLNILSQLTICNCTDQPLEGLTLTVESTPEILLPFHISVAYVPPQSEFVVQDLNVQANAAFLSTLTERISGQISLRLTKGDSLLADYQSELIALAFDEWHGTAFFPELVTAFITPNHPEVTKLVARGAEILKQWTGDPSLDAYQRENPNRVRMQAAALYAALQAQNIVYSVPPASFERIGQRVRLCGDVIQQKMGTCLDLTLLYASCLEAIGLHPLLVFQPGHVFAGLWLENETFPEAVQDDAALLTKRLADGVTEVAVLECTSLVAGQTVDFDASCAVAERELNAPVDLIVDVTRARLSGIRPLPQRIQQGGSWQITVEERPVQEMTTAPQERAEAVVVQEGPVAPSGKMAQWERKLLDLGLRNSLINLRLTKRVIPILADSLGDLEDALSSGEEYGISPRPQEWERREAQARDLEQFANLNEYRPLIRSEFQQNRLRSGLNPAELNQAVTQLYRAARVSMEESGANTLYLALGLLRWYETRTSERPRYAPLVLLPVEIVRKSAKIGYVIRLRDEEPQMNISLLEMLKQDFGISVGGLDPLPQDEHGVDLRAVYTVIRRAVMDQSRWDVVEAAFLGLFSFTQFVMWNDLRNRTEDLTQNRLVRSLVEGKLAWTPQPLDADAPVKEDGTLLPIPADASQLYAIQQAAAGQSFVLHGPPGTGKSQTITALIANALAQGKRVLFVAEKMAALSVVQRRLEKIGLGAFCLELHSNKSKKRDVLEQLKAATEVTRGRPRESWQEEAERTAALRAELDEYAAALHQIRPCGFSVWELVNRYEDCQQQAVIPSLPAEFAQTATKSSLETQNQLAGRLVAAGREVGHPAGNPLRLVGRADYDPALRAALPPVLSACSETLAQLEQEGRLFAQAVGQQAPERMEQWRRQNQLADTLSAWFELPRAWIFAPEREVLLSDLERLANHRVEAAKLADQLSEHWQAHFLEQNAAQLKEAWDQASLQWFLPRMLAQGRIVKLLRPDCKGTVRKETLSEELLQAKRYQEERKAAQELEDRQRGALSGLEQKSPDELRAMISQTRTLFNILCEFVGEEQLRTLSAKPELRELAGAFLDRCIAAKDAWAQAAQLIQPDEAAVEGMTLSELRQAVQDLEGSLDGLRDWCLWNGARTAAVKAGMGTLVEAYTGGLPHEQVEGAWQRAATVALLSAIIGTDQVLGQFSGAVFQEKIRQFKEMDQRLLELAQREIFCRLAANIPDFTRAAATNSEVGILQRAIRSGGRGTSIRKLFKQIPTLLPLLCPCMLMSPLSVAQYLDPKQKPFDLVVFDEASQLPTCKAVGALARGENAVIVGDPKQMPPTSFFSSNATDEENLEQEDLESILDDCLALNMPQSYLLWHYRSRHESLIVFSNRMFYENQLYTFPSARDQERMVRLVHVDGYFDRGKTRQNRGEAEAVVAELSRRAHDPALSGASVGVVTFNVNQQELINDLLDEACAQDPELENWAYHAPEPLFIKNLENVQGDERDVILFSVGYGPDQQEKVTMNFGPLNREGGWRRLNVAVSRARQEMVVYATLRPEQIDLSRTSARGVAALRDFLIYASSGTLREDAASVHAARNDVGGIIRDICAVLQANGYQTRCQVGRSRYRLDIGVVDAARPGRYLAGILLDGETYHQARTTRDRELAQQAVLQNLGWKLYRVWTIDWLERRQKEIDRLLAYLAEAEKGAQEPEPETQAAPPEAPVRVAGLVFEPPVVIEDAVGPEPEVYQVARLSARPLSAEAFLLPENQGTILRALQRVIELEAPVSETLLIRRVVQCFGLARAGTRIQRQMLMLLSSMKLQKTVQEGQVFYWSDKQDPETYPEFRAGDGEENKRDAKDLPVQEVANAAATVLRQQVGLPEEDLIRESARLMGYSRVGAAMRQAMINGIAYGKEQGRLLESQPGYFILAGD